MISVVSSFSPTGYEVYGKQFVETWLEHWPQDVELHLYLEPSQPALPKDPRIREHYLWNDRDFMRFRKRYKNANGIVEKDGKLVKAYNHDAIRFAPKVYAETDPLAPHNGWRIWLDADVENFAKIDKAFLEETCREDAVASYLHRIDWHHSECGFVAWNMQNGGAEFLRRMRAMYDNGLLFGLNEWHDSYVWDFVRKGMEREGYKFHNLAEGAGGIHPWPCTILGDYMTHNKGPRAKMDSYGEIA